MLRESSPSTALRHKILLSNLWKFARGFAEFKRNGKTNPTADAINLYTVEQEHEPWPDEVQDRFTAACDKNLYLAYHLLLCTGQRVSDVVNMKWADYNSTHFKLTQIKTNTEMWIKAPKILRELLAKTDRVHENILTHKWGKPYTRDSLGHRIKDVLIGNGDGRYTTHGLRKNAGILLAENGATVPQIMAALGHTTPKLALYYCRLAQQKLLNDRQSPSWTTCSSGGRPTKLPEWRHGAPRSNGYAKGVAPRRGNARHFVAICSSFGRCEAIEITQSSRKLPNCDNS